MTKQNKITELAFEKGYRVMEDGSVKGVRGDILKLSMSNRGYISFNVRIDKNSVSRVFVHKLQAFQKFGKKLFKKNIVVRHLNGDREDNSFGNISLGTQSQNMFDIPRNVRKKKSSNPKLNHELILKDRADGLTYRELMQKHNIASKGTLSFIINKSLKSNTAVNT